MNVQSEAVCGRSAVTEPSRQRPATDYCLSPRTTCADEVEGGGLVSHYTTCLHLVKTRTMKQEPNGPNFGQLLYRLAHFGQRSNFTSFLFGEIWSLTKYVSLGQENE